jgi:hypothetical protein
MAIDVLEKRVRILIIFFILALAISGITAIPLVWETTVLKGLFGEGTRFVALWPSMSAWIEKVSLGVGDTNSNYPFMLYGTDWLAFGHIVIAIAFIGPLRDPIKNIWVIEFGMIACILIIPWGIIFGLVREIPSFWSLIDFSFGVLGIIPLWLVYRDIHLMEKIKK